MSDWKIAMVVLLPLLAVGDRKWIRGIPVPWGPLARTWLAMMLAGMIASGLPYDSVRTFAVIDFAAAAVILSSPRGEAQRLVGFIFGGMVFAHAGFYSSIAGQLQPGPDDFLGYAILQRLLGWAEYVALLAGGIYAAERSFNNWRDARGRGVHIRMGAP